MLRNSALIYCFMMCNHTCANEEARARGGSTISKKAVTKASWLWSANFRVRESSKQWHSQPSLSGGVTWKNLPNFCLFSSHLFLIFLIFTLFSCFPSFSRFFPSFSWIWQIFCCRRALLPPLAMLMAQRGQAVPSYPCFSSHHQCDVIGLIYFTLKVLQRITTWILF